MATLKVLEACNLYRFYHAGEDETLALRGVSISIEAGEIVALMGPSGSGKSTLLACLAGLDEPDGGHVEVLGKRLTRRSELERSALRAAHIGLLLQSGNLFAHLTLEENILLSMELAQKVNRQWLADLLEMVGLDERRHAYPTHLSGGEAARAGLVVALAAQPSILLADEPTSEVDAETEARLIALFAGQRSQGRAIVIATHSALLAASADRVVHLLDGNVTDV